MKKKLMLLGGIRYLMPAVETAHKIGVDVLDESRANVAEFV